MDNHSQSAGQPRSSDDSVADAPTVLWDIDGTIIDSEPLHRRSLIESLAAFGVDADEDTLHAATIGRSAYDAFLYCRESFGLNAVFAEWIAFRHRCYLEYAPRLQGFAMTCAVYARLRQAGVRQAFVSNSDRQIVEANLSALGLAEPNLISLSRNDVRDGKPAPEPYLRAAWLLRSDPARCVVIEDSATGAQAGSKAGMHVIAVVETKAATHGARAVFADGVTATIGLDEDETILLDAIYRQQSTPRPV